MDGMGCSGVFEPGSDILPFRSVPSRDRSFDPEPGEDWSGLVHRDKVEILYCWNGLPVMLLVVRRV